MRAATVGGMNNYADLARTIENLIRFGVIAEVQMKPVRVRVKISELLTTWLPWIAVRAGTEKGWDPPTVGEQVMLSAHLGI